MKQPARVVYCNCTYAKVIPAETKRQVLRELSASCVTFDTVADLCEMSARRDPMLKQVAETDCVKIVACFPRAVKWLFHAAGTPLSRDGVEVLNMRKQGADEIVSAVVNGKPAKRTKSL